MSATYYENTVRLKEELAPVIVNVDWADFGIHLSENQIQIKVTGRGKELDKKIAEVLARALAVSSKKLRDMVRDEVSSTLDHVARKAQEEMRFIMERKVS